ncbi:MAG: HAD-IA family hydrolase [bacterium]|nr:HAD-IA family hydrolase [bacterium]
MRAVSEAAFQVRAVTFDATGTLFHCPELGSIYSEILTRHGAEVSSDRAGELVRTVWREFDCRANAGSAGFLANRFGPGRSEARGWWTDFVARILEYLESPAEPAFAAAELFERFSRPESWEVFPEACEVLTELRARGYLLGVISNWDHRLAGLLDGLELPGFDALAYSAEVGFEKPHPAIFESCLDRLGVPARACLHVGDRILEDCEGARGAGLSALLLDRSRAQSARRASVSDLRRILGRLPRLPPLPHPRP